MPRAPRFSNKTKQNRTDTTGHDKTKQNKIHRWVHCNDTANPSQNNPFRVYDPWYKEENTYENTSDSSNIEQPTATVVLPYVKCISEKLQRPLKIHNIQVAHRPIKRLANIFHGIEVCRIKNAKTPGTNLQNQTNINKHEKLKQ